MPKHAEKHHEPHLKHAGQHPETLSGVIQNYNFSPKGGVEGLLLQEGHRIVQVNIPPDLWPVVATSAVVGQAVEATVLAEPVDHKHPEGEHPVYRAVSIQSSGGPGSRGERPDHNGVVKVEGVVARFNFAKHGEANGVVLETGDFVHLKPDGMRKVGLKVGQPVEAEGSARPMLLGNRVVEATVVNGVAIGPKGPRH